MTTPPGNRIEEGSEKKKSAIDDISQPKTSATQTSMIHRLDGFMKIPLGEASSKT
jgi:hypothetical protein